jgi:membrane-associated progesterone receptor component
MVRVASSSRAPLGPFCCTQLTLFAPLVFAGKEPNRALGLSSLKLEDCISDYSDLSEKEQQVLNDWHTFFTKRYNIVGRLEADGNSSL